MCIEIIILIIFIILLIYCKLINKNIKENIQNKNKTGPLLKRTTKDGNELIGKTINIKDGGIYKKLIENVGYDSITFETDATHNLFIYLGYVGGQENQNYIRNPIYQNSSGNTVALNGDIVALNDTSNEITANAGTGNLGYEIALNEKLEGYQRYFLRGPNDSSEPISAVTLYRSTISDNALQKHISKNCAPICPQNQYLNEGNKYISISKNKNIKDNLFQMDANFYTGQNQNMANLLHRDIDLYGNYSNSYAATNTTFLDFDGGMKQYIIDNLNNRNLSLTNIPIDITNNNKILTSSEANAVFDKYGYIPLNFNHDPYILTKKPQKCELLCGNNLCIELTVSILLNDGDNSETSVLKDDIIKLMLHIEDNKIGYDNGLKYNVNGCQYYSVPYGMVSLGSNKAYPFYSEQIDYMQTNAYGPDVEVQDLKLYTTHSSENPQPNSMKYGYFSMNNYNNTIKKIRYSKRTVNYLLLVPKSGTDLDHYSSIKLNEISNTCIENLNKWKNENNIRMRINNITITNNDIPISLENKLTPITQQVDINTPATNIIKIMFDRNNRNIKVYKCENWDNNSKTCVKPILILTHGLSTPNINENQLIYYPEIWVGFKEDLRQNVATLKNNKTRYHNFENRNNVLPENPNTPGINITIKHIGFNFQGYDPDPSSLINYTYSAGACIHSGDSLMFGVGDLSSRPSYYENCIKKCNEDELCTGFTFVDSPIIGDRSDTRNDRLNWSSVGSCNLHKANESNLGKIESSKFIDLDFSNPSKKYLQNIPNNEHCFVNNKTIDTSAYFKNTKTIKINEFKKAKYTPLRNYLNILNGTNINEDYPTWMVCDVVNDKVVCNDSNTINKFIELINQIKVKLFMCNRFSLCSGGFKSGNIADPNKTIIVNTLIDLENYDQYDNYDKNDPGNYSLINNSVEYESFRPISTVYFVKETFVAYVTLLLRIGVVDTDYSIKIKKKYNYIKEFAAPVSAAYNRMPDRRPYFIIVPLFEYLSCTQCTPSKLLGVQKLDESNVQTTSYLRLLNNKLNEINIYTCETPEISTNAFDNPINSKPKPRFVQVYPSVRFKGLRFRIKGACPVHIIIGNINDNDRVITKTDVGLSVIPQSGNGIQISMDVFLNDGLGSYILKKSTNTLTYEMLSEFTSQSNAEIKSNIGYVDGDDDFLPKIKMLSLDNTNINSLLGVSKQSQYDSSGHRQDIYTYNKNNGVAGLYQSFIIDFDEINNILYVLYKSSISQTYSLLMKANVNFAEVLGVNYKLYIISGTGPTQEQITYWQADLYKYENNTNKPSGDNNCYNIISYKQSRPEKSPLIQDVPNYTKIGQGKCMTTNNKIPAYRSMVLTYDPLTNYDLDLRQKNPTNLLAAYNACSAFCSPEPNGVNKANDCIGFNLNETFDSYFCQLYANKSYNELGLRSEYYSDGLSFTAAADLCPNVCDTITKTYNACEKESNGCRKDEPMSPQMCYSRDNANIITTQQLINEKQLNVLIEEQMRAEANAKMNAFKQQYIPKTPERTICPENDYITKYDNCICPSNKTYKYMPAYDSSGNSINPNKDLKCGTVNDANPKQCGTRNSSTTITDPTCICPWRYYIKVKDGINYWCDLVEPTQKLNWSNCIPNEIDPTKGSQFKSGQISFIGQGDAAKCQGQNITIDTQSCKPTNLSLDYWVKAFRNAGKGDEKGCNSSWFTSTDDYVWDKYKNGIEFYNENKNNNFDYQYLLNWAQARLNDGHGVCNNRWRGPEGKCVAAWEKTNVTDDYYTCQIDSGQCILQNHNTKRTQMDKDLIDVIFDKSQNGKTQCEINCPIISHALKNQATQSTLPDGVPTSWHHGNCDNLWSGGKRNVYWACEPDKGSGVYGVNPVLLTEARATNDPIVKNYISKTKEDAIIKCTPYPPEYEGPQIDYFDHISYISALNAQFDENDSARYPINFANENSMKNWHDANPLEKHVEVYGDKISWFTELLRYKTRDSSNVFDPSNKKCAINLDDINLYEHPRKHLADYLKAGHPNECILAKETYNDINDLQNNIYGSPEPELGEIFYIRSTNTAYKVERGRIGGFIPNKWNARYNENSSQKGWPNIEYNQKYNYSMRIVEYNPNCVSAKDKTKLNFYLKWGDNNDIDHNDSKLSFYGYAQQGAQLSPPYGGSNGSLTVNSVYNCAQSCRDHPECKYFTYHSGKDSGYFKGYGSASIYPSNSYPRTYHGSSFGGQAHDAASTFFDPFSQYNQQSYNVNSNLFGFFRRGKINLTPITAKQMGCTWATGVDDKSSSIDNDTHLSPITLMINVTTNCEAWGCRGDVFIKSGSIPGLNEDILFPYWFLNNRSFDFLNDKFPISNKTAYENLETIIKEYNDHISTFNEHVNNIVRLASDDDAKLQTSINKLNTYKKTLPNTTPPNYILQYTLDIETQRNATIASNNLATSLLKEKKLKDDKMADAVLKLPILAKNNLNSNTTLFNKIPVGYYSPFQRYNINGQRDPTGPRLMYLVPPMINEINNGITEKNIAVYRYTEINIANVNTLAISCDDMMNNTDKLNNNTCKNNINQPCNTTNVLSGTKNYKGPNNNNLNGFWTIISRTSYGNVTDSRCELFNFNVDDPIISKNESGRTLSGVLTDRSKYTGPKIRKRNFYENESPSWTKNNPNVNVKQIGERYLVTSDKEY